MAFDIASSSALRRFGLSRLGLIMLLLAGSALRPAFGADIGSGISTEGEGRTPDFYNYRGTPAGRPGDLLRMEQLEPEMLFDGAVTGYRLLYVSTDGVSQKARVAVSAALFLPAGEPPVGGWPLVAWAHGTVGINDICAPSLQGRSLRDANYLAHWLAGGFAVVATDYQGLGAPGPHPYLEPRSEAFSVLDSIRAAMAADRRIGSKSVVIGQSQGGEASFATAVHAKSYAPELDLRGIVATGTVYYRTPSDALGGETEVSDTADDTVYSRLYLLISAERIAGVDITDATTPAALPALRQARGVCNTRLEFDVESTKLTRKTAFSEAGFTQAISKIFPLLQYDSLSASVPVFLGIGEADEEVAMASQLSLAREACQAGASVEAHVYRRASHGQTVSRAIAEEDDFIHRVLGANPHSPKSVCSPVYHD